ncbi:MAG: hypothetical protein AB9834_07275 [Lentimicrobium sp.]
MTSVRSSFLIIQLLLLFTGVSRSMAQQSAEKEKFCFSLNFGGRYINRDSLANSNDLDFMNYLYKQDNAAEYGYISLNFSMAPSEKIEFSATAVLLSDLSPNQFNLDIRYKPVIKYNHIGWGLIGSFIIYPQYLENFNSFHILSDTGFTADLNPNFRQISIYDLGIAAGPTMNYQYRRFFAEISFRTGISGFISFNERISQKKTDANLIREIHYETSYSPAVFFMPEAELGYKITSGGRLNFGINLKTGGMWSKRAINYTRTTYNWTPENVTISDVHPDETWYSKTEIQGGFYITF